MNIDRSGWMGSLHDLIADTPLCLVPIPGSHDSGSYGSYATDGTAKTQSLSVAQQLALGIRFFDLRVRAHATQFFVHHGPTPTNNDFYDAAGHGIFADVRDFVNANAREIVILHCWDMDDSPAGSGFSTDAQRNAAFATLADTVFGSKLIAPTNDGPSQTVRQLLARGNLIVVTDFAVAGSAGAKFWKQQDAIVDYYAPPTISVPTTKIESGGNSQGLTVASVQSLLNGLETALGKRDLRKFHKFQAIFAYDAVLLSGFASMMEYGAQRLNPIAVTKFRDLALHGSTPVNIIIADFVEYGQFVEAVISAIRHNWPVSSIKASAGTPASPLLWNSKAAGGWLCNNPNAQVVSGSAQEAWKLLVGLWVKGNGSYGVVDFAPVFAAPGSAGGNPKPGANPPSNLQWHYGHMNASNGDARLLSVPDGDYITGIDVVEQGDHGIVNVRVRGKDGQPGAAAWSDAATSPWSQGEHSMAPVIALESATQGNYGVVDFRYATNKATHSWQRAPQTEGQVWSEKQPLEYVRDVYGTVRVRGAASFVGPDYLLPTLQNPVALFRLPGGYLPAAQLEFDNLNVTIAADTGWVCALAPNVQLEGINFVGAG